MKDISNKDAEKIPCNACQGGGCPSCGGYGYLPQWVTPKEKFTMQDFKKGLMLAGLVKPANEKEQAEFDLLSNKDAGGSKVADKVHYDALMECCEKLLDAVDKGTTPVRQLMGLRILLNRTPNVQVSDTRNDATHSTADKQIN